jgi:hypothetical protein
MIKQKKVYKPHGKVYVVQKLLTKNTPRLNTNYLKAKAKLTRRLRIPIKPENSL